MTKSDQVRTMMRTMMIMSVPRPMYIDIDSLLAS